MIAYKGMCPGMVCLGYQLKVGLNVTEQANCQANGFHCAANPMDCLRYYTVEAEPGGTVRQVRTQYNRQNDDIGEVRAFLKIWQKQLAKRLTQKDKQLAADSHELRIKELVQLRNDQVTIHTGDLAGRLLVDVLTEDLMEAA